MGLFEHFPYTNFHELNLNWILEELKKLKDSNAEIDNKIIDTIRNMLPEYVFSAFYDEKTLTIYINAKEG